MTSEALAVDRITWHGGSQMKIYRVRCACGEMFRVSAFLGGRGPSPDRQRQVACECGESDRLHRIPRVAVAS